MFCLYNVSLESWYFGFEENYPRKHLRMLRAVLNYSKRQHPTKQQMYSHLPPITKTIQVRRPRHAGHCWRSKDELIGDIFLWTPSHGRAKVGQAARIYIQLLCADTGYSLEDLPGAMGDRDGWQERPGRSVLAAQHDDDDIYTNCKSAWLHTCRRFGLVSLFNDISTLVGYLMQNIQRVTRLLVLFEDSRYCFK